MFSRRKNSTDLVLPGEKGEKERVALLQHQVKSLSETAAQAVDRSAALEKEVAHLREALYQQGRYQVHLQDRFNQAHLYHEHSISLQHQQAKLSNSDSMSSFVSDSDKSSDSFASLFSDNSALSNTTIPENGLLIFEEDNFPLFTTPELDLTLQYQHKVDESEQQRQKLQDALAQERALRESYEKQLTELKNQIESMKLSNNRDKTTASSSTSTQMSCNQDIRLRKLEISVNAIRKARDVLNSPRLYQYV